MLSERTIRLKYKSRYIRLFHDKNTISFSVAVLANRNKSKQIGIKSDKSPILLSQNDA